MPEKSQEFLLKGVQLATNLISVAGAMQLAEAPYVGPRPLMKRLPNRRTEVILYTKKQISECCKCCPIDIPDPMNSVANCVLMQPPRKLRLL